MAKEQIKTLAHVPWILWNAKRHQKVKTTFRVMEDLRHTKDTRAVQPKKETNARGLIEMHKIRNGLERGRRLIIIHVLYFSKGKI